MLSKFDHILQTSKVIQLEWNIQADEECFVRSLIIEKKKEELKWKDAKEWTKQDELLKYLKKKKLPISIAFLGKGVLSKTSNKISESPQEVVENMIPSGLAESYYLSSIQLQNSMFASIVRKEIIDSVLIDLKDLPIIHLSIGAQQLLAFTILFEEKLPVQIYKYRLQNQEGESPFEITDDDYQAFELNVGKESISSNYLLCLCNAASYLFDLFPLVEQIPDSIIAKEKDYRYKVVLDKISKPLVILFLVVFLGNFLFLQKLENRYLNLFTSYEVNKEQSELVSSLEKEIKERESLFQQSGWKSSLNIAQISDQLAATVPKNIALDKLEFQPLLQSLKEGTRADFSLNKIIIEGQVNNSSTLNDWINNLKSKDFVREVMMADYQVERNKTWATFKLNLEVE